MQEMQAIKKKLEVGTKLELHSCAWDNSPSQRASV